MEKTLYPDDHPSLIQAAGGMKFQLFDPSTTKITKSASEGISRDVVAQNMPGDDHFLLHVVAMGSDEQYGFNRNGDGFSKSALAKYHPTFVSNGHFYREHRNRCPDTQGIGMIKHSAYNKPMSRVELLVWGDKRKAEEEYEMAKSGSELSFSMSARLPGDECSCCGNFARNLGSYCDHLKNSMGQYLPEMKKYAYAKNNNNVTFYDISRVGKPADRIAHYLDYKFGSDSEGMAKAASDTSNLIISGAEWAKFEGVNLGDNNIQWDLFEGGMLDKLAAYEEKNNNFDKQAGTLNDYERTLISQVAPSAMKDHELTQEEIQTLRGGYDLPNVFGELCKNACILCMDDFSSLVTGDSKESLRSNPEYRSTIKVRIPTMFNDAKHKGCDCAEAAGLLSPTPEGCSFEGKQDLLDNVMERVSESMGMEDNDITSRATRIIVIKQASHVDVSDKTKSTPFYDALVDAYTTYVVKCASFMQRHSDKGVELLPAAITTMNRS